MTPFRSPYAPLRVLDLFSAAAGGWTLGLHRAGFVTVAACEIVEWRRILYAGNNSHVRLYDDVRTLTAGRLVSDLGYLPDIIAGSPPCQDISPANTKGRGVDGERSRLYFEAIRLIGECRPRWFALENSAGLRTRGADRVLGALEALGYAVEACVVAAAHVGANHERKRSWLIGHDPEQIADAGLAIAAGRDAYGRRRGRAKSDEGVRPVRCVPQHPDGDAACDGCAPGRTRRRVGPAHGTEQSSRRDADTTGVGHESGRPWRCWPDGHGTTPPQCSGGAGNTADADEAGSPDGLLERRLRPAEITVDGCGDGRRDDGSGDGEMGRGARVGDAAAEPWADWNGGPARHLLLDDGLSAWLAGTRVALGDGTGALAASLIVEAFGDAVVPQIPEAIGRAILRTELALDAVFGRGLSCIPVSRDRHADGDGGAP
ncbi:DNA cytosine methyltransferase [Nguyenibacter vanlangensis]|uniref:DNA (cytosine-5-)-methyltransferase n=1 Tax=Nguyenibacter vanlangensis TaxID=1216886 RepID=A0ABZ3D9L2_9PROT